ncbi:uncharacterized protein [Cherax quadricarinatus]
MWVLALFVSTTLVASITSTQHTDNEDGFSHWAQIPSAAWEDGDLEDDDIFLSKDLIEWLHQNSDVLESTQETENIIEMLASGEADKSLTDILKIWFHNLDNVLKSENHADDNDEFLEDLENALKERVEHKENIDLLDATDLSEESEEASDKKLLKKLVSAIDNDCDDERCEDTPIVDSSTEDIVLRRNKRSPARVRSSSRRSGSRSSGSSWLGKRKSTSKPSSSSSSSSRSSSSSSRGSSSTGSIGGSSGTRVTSATGAAAGAGATTGVSGSGYPSGIKPGGGYPTGSQPSPGYPSGTNPVGGYPTGTKPVGGYPAGGYPTGTHPAGGYPTGTHPAGGYPTGTHPAGGYPTGTHPSGNQPAGWNPTGNQPGGGYPAGNRPIGWNPNAQPSGGYPTGTQPVPGYPGGTRPFGSYPTDNRPNIYPSYIRPPPSYLGAGQPYGGFPTATRPGGYPMAGMSAGATAGGFGGYPVGGYPMPKKTKKGKVKEVIEKAVAGYALHKASKKNKFLSPSLLSGYGHGFGHGGLGHGGFGHGGLGHGGFGHGGFGKLAAGGLVGGLAAGKAGKIAKKLLGAYVKIQIAKYALKFGAEAAKAYFLYKMGLELDEYMIGKFVHRYHQHRVRGDNRWQYYQHHNRKNMNSVADNITLGEFCRRPCAENDTRICQFNFDVHFYQTMSRACYDCPRNVTDCDRPECVVGDGIRRMVVTINKLIPGPPIEVCVGDKVLVDVMNNLPSTALALHWHGLTMGPSRAMPNARQTPYMDGTPGVTQCPIPPGSGFRYSFFASNPGTHFWHAQTGFERGDGVFGPIIVHQPVSKDPNQFLAEHLLTINDWFHKTTQTIYANKNSDGRDPTPDSLLINGRGPQQHLEDTVKTPRVPYAKFLVENGTRYRLRIINAAIAHCPVTVTIDNHDLILLAADGASVSPVNTSAILIHPGERYDAMFSAEHDPNASGGTYWIRVTGGGHCAGLHQYAALQYLPSNFTDFQQLPAIPPTPTPAANPSPGAEEFSGRCGTQGQRCVAALQALALPEKLKIPKTNNTFYLAFSSKTVHNQNFYSLIYYNIYDESWEKRVLTPQINHLTFRAPPKPLLVNRKPLKSENCSADGVRRGQCSADYCECIHALHVSLGAIVDLVLIGEGPANGTSYPVHLHGYKFWVLSQVEASQVPTPSKPPPTPSNATLSEVDLELNLLATKSEFLTRETVMQLDQEGKLLRNLEDPVMKDSVSIPPGGYTVVRIAAENSGVWMLESQVLMDAQAGMSLVLQVGTAADVPKSPPPDFPTC